MFRLAELIGWAWVAMIALGLCLWMAAALVEGRLEAAPAWSTLMLLLPGLLLLRFGK